MTVKCETHEIATLRQQQKEELLHVKIYLTFVFISGDYPDPPKLVSRPTVWEPLNCRLYSLVRYNGKCVKTVLSEVLITLMNMFGEVKELIR